MGSRAAILAILFLLGLVGAQAASLDKYSSPPSYEQRAVPTVPQQKNNRLKYEPHIKNALAVLAKMSPQEQARMLRIYSEKRDSAYKDRNYEEAYYYNEIISRWNAR